MNTVYFQHLRERISKIHPRTRKVQLNILFGLVIKGGGMFISLLLVPLTIDYLSKDVYGTWLTISSIVTMIAFFDIGIGNGLRNKLTEAVSKQDLSLARTYISTAYAAFGILQLIFIVIFAVIFRYLPWQRILNTSVSNDDIQTVVFIMATAIAIKLMLDVLSYVLLSLQESGQVSFINFVSNLIILFATYALTRLGNGNIIYLGIVTASSPIVVLLISGFVLYRTKLKLYKPSIRLINFEHTKDLLSLGYKFFFIQMTVIILVYTDNLIITQLFGPSEVTTYNVAFRYFNALTTIFTIIVMPYWSAFTEAYVKSDSLWMKRTYTYLQKLWIGLMGLAILAVFMANYVYTLWIGSRVTVPMLLNICMGVLVISTCWNIINTAVINGVGKIRLQLYYSIFSAVINIPLSILLGRVFQMGSAGVTLATSISIGIGAIFSAIQVRKIISGTAKGIWDK